MHDYWNQWPWVILGAEGDGENSEGENGENGDGEGEENEDNSNDADNANDNANTEGKTAEDFAALAKALAAERRNTKRLERENKKLAGTQQQKTAEEDSDLQRVQEESEQNKQKAAKLAAGLLKRDIDDAIKRAATDAKFIDVTDALNGVDRDLITFDQDEDDPTDIEIDEDTVVKAVKALAAKKSHWISKGTDDGEATGSAFGGSKRKKPTSSEQYKELYPSL